MQTQTEISVPTLRLKGIVGIEEAIEIQPEVLRMAEQGGFAIDCSGAERIHCAALQLFISAQADTEKTGPKLRLLGMSPELKEFCSLAGFDRLLAFE
jgi:anti-anti-sigma factor